MGVIIYFYFRQVSLGTIIVNLFLNFTYYVGRSESFVVHMFQKNCSLCLLCFEGNLTSRSTLQYLFDCDPQTNT